MMGMVATHMHMSMYMNTCGARERTCMQLEMCILVDESACIASEEGWSGRGRVPAALEGRVPEGRVPEGRQSAEGVPIQLPRHVTSRSLCPRRQRSSSPGDNLPPPKPARSVVQAALRKKDAAPQA